MLKLSLVSPNRYVNMSGSILSLKDWNSMHLSQHTRSSWRIRWVMVHESFYLDFLSFSKGKASSQFHLFPLWWWKATATICFSFRVVQANVRMWDTFYSVFTLVLHSCAILFTYKTSCRSSNLDFYLVWFRLVTRTKHYTEPLATALTVFAFLHLQEICLLRKYYQLC